MATQKQINLMAYKEWVKPEDISKRIWTIAPWALAMDKNGSYGIDFKKDLYDYSKAPESTEWGLVLDGAVVKRPTTNQPISAEEQQFNILPESVTWVKPYISPTLQAKIDAKKTPVTPVQPTPAPVTTEEVVTPVVEPVKPVETKPVEVAPVAPAPVTTPVTPELTDIEKQAQATWVKYTMVNGLPEYEPTNKEEALKILQSGGKFSAENGMTAVAKANLDKYRKYAQMTDTQLAQNIVNGNVSSRELEQITSINPDLVAKAKDMARKSTITDTANTIQVANDSIVKGEDTQVQNKALTNLLTKLGELDANAESYGDIKARVYANYPDMEVARGEIVNAQTQLRQLQRAKRDLFADYKKKNSSLPISMIMAGYSALSKGIDDQIYEVNDTLSQNVALYNSYLDEAKSEIDWEVGNQAKQEQRLFDMYGVTNAAEIRQEDLIRKDQELAAAMEQAQSKQEYDMFKDERDYNFKVAEAISKENYQNRQLGIQERAKASDFLKFEVPNEDGSVSTVYRNPMTGQEMASSTVYGSTPSTTQGQDAPIGKVFNLFSPTGQALLWVPDGTVVPTRLGEVSPQNAQVRGKECAEFVNDVYGNLLPKKLGSTYQDKLDVCNETTGGIGSVAAWQPEGSGKYGHTGIVVDEDASNYYVKSSNYTPWTVTTVPVPKDNIKNFYTPPEIKQAQEQESVWPQPIKYANGNVRTPEGTLYTKKEVTEMDNKIKSDEQYKRASTTLQYFRALDKLNQLVEKYGTEIWPLASVQSAFGGTKKSELQEAYNNILFAEKEYRNLGVLNWPDVGLLTSGLPSPVSFKYTNAAGDDIDISGTPSNNKVLQGIKSKKLTLQKELEDTYNTLNVGNQNLGDTLPSLKALNDIRKRAQLETEESDVESFINQK